MAGVLPLLLSISRFHIAFVGASGSLTFGYLLTGKIQPLLAFITLLDWFIVNLFNKVVDYKEDLTNGIAHASFFAKEKNRKAVNAFLWILLIGSSLLCPSPAFFFVRVCYHFLGYIYNNKCFILGNRRLKEMYFWKNTASMVGFYLTLFCYPLSCLKMLAVPSYFEKDWNFDISSIDPAAGPLQFLLDLPKEYLYHVLALMAFFGPHEYAFEVIYDIRDYVGDKQEGIKSYAVVKGKAWASRLVLILDIVSIAAILLSLMTGILIWKQGVLIMGPVLRLIAWYFWSMNPSSITEPNVQRLTWSFVGAQIFFVCWNISGMPTDAAVVFGDLNDPIRVVVYAMLFVGFFTFGWTVRFFGTWKWFLGYVLVGLCGCLCENTAIKWYDFYHYDKNIWNAYIGVIPLEVTLIWPQVILCSYRLWRENFKLKGWKLALIGGFEVFQLAFFVEVCCVYRGFWTWTKSNLAGVPIIGVIGWGVYGVVAHLALEELSYGKWWKALALPITSMIAVHSALYVFWNYLGFKTFSDYDIPLETAGPATAIIFGTQAILQVVLGLKRFANVTMIQEIPRQFAAVALGYVLLSGPVKPSLNLMLIPMGVACAYYSMLHLGWPEHLLEQKKQEEEISDLVTRLGLSEAAATSVVTGRRLKVPLPPHTQAPSAKA